MLWGAVIQAVNNHSWAAAESKSKPTTTDKMECFPEDTELLKAKTHMLQPQKNKGKEARGWGRKARLQKTKRYQRSHGWSWPWEWAGNLRAVHQVAKPHVEISKLEWEKSKAQLGKCLTTEAKEENTCAKCFSVRVRSSRLAQIGIPDWGSTELVQQFNSIMD